MHGAAKLKLANNTLRTAVLHVAGNETLLWMVSNVCCEKWKDKSLMAIHRCHLHPIFSSTNEQCQDGSHTFVVMGEASFRPLYTTQGSGLSRWAWGIAEIQVNNNSGEYKCTTDYLYTQESWLCGNECVNVSQR
jgi:hypothetical protein